MTTTDRQRFQENLQNEMDAVLLLVLMALFIGPVKIIPMAFALATIYITLARPTLFDIG